MIWITRCKNSKVTWVGICTKGNFHIYISWVDNIFAFENIISTCLSQFVGNLYGSRFEEIWEVWWAYNKDLWSKISNIKLRMWLTKSALMKVLFHEITKGAFLKIFLKGVPGSLLMIAELSEKVFLHFYFSNIYYCFYIKEIVVLTLE